jgi:hypothetical protein
MHDSNPAVIGEVRGAFTEGFRAGWNFEFVVGAHNKDTALFLLHNPDDKGEAIPAQVVKVNFGTLAVKMIEIFRSEQDGLDREDPCLRFVGYSDGKAVYKALSKGVVERAEIASRHVMVLVGKAIGFEQRLVTVHGQPLPGLSYVSLVCDARKGMPMLRMETILLSRRRLHELQEEMQKLSTF